MDRQALIAELARLEGVLADHHAVRTVDEIRRLLAELRADPAVLPTEAAVKQLAAVGFEPIPAVVAGTCDRDGCGAVYARGDIVGRTRSGRVLCGGCLP